MILHAGCVARVTRSGWAGALLAGPSGIGKSDLMLRLLERGWTLVADDRTAVWTSGGRLYGKAPPPLANLIEARGLDVVSVCRRDFVRVALWVDCVGPDGELDRIPARETRRVEGIVLESIGLRPLEGSAPAKIERALLRARF